MTCRKTIPSPEDLTRAERQVVAGIYSRLLARYITEFPERFASFLAMAVTKTLLSHTAEDEREKRFQEENSDQIREQINALRDDIDIGGWSRTRWSSGSVPAEKGWVQCRGIVQPPSRS
jgi:hypothetical protein